LLDCARDPRPARTPTGFRAIELVGDQLAVPGQDGVRLRDSCNLGEGLAAQPMTNFAQRGSLGVRKLQPSFQLGFEDAVFRCQIFISRQQLLIHRPGDVGQDARPIHNGPLVPTRSVMEITGGASEIAILAVDN